MHVMMKLESLMNMEIGKVSSLSDSCADSCTLRPSELVVREAT